MTIKVRYFTLDGEPERSTADLNPTTGQAVDCYTGETVQLEMDPTLLWVEAGYLGDGDGLNVTDPEYVDELGRTIGFQNPDPSPDFDFKPSPEETEPVGTEDESEE